MQRVPNKIVANRPTPRHIIIKISKFKDKKRFLKEREEKLVTRRVPDGRGKGKMGKKRGD